MESVLEVFNRIRVVTALTFREAVRRKLLLILLLGCMAFMGIGSLCNGLARASVDSNLERQRFMIEEQMRRQGVPPEEIESQLQEFDAQRDEMRKEEERSYEMGGVFLTYASFAFWTFALALIFTPFLALNDLYTRNHVLLLARPLQRWEYLLGRAAGLFAMILGSLLALGIVFHAFMLLAHGTWGFGIWRGVLILLEGLVVWLMLLFVLTLLVGRIPAIFLGLVILGVSVIANWGLILEADLDGAYQAALYGLGYGLPQFGVNFVHGWIESVRDYPEAAQLTGQLRLGQVGNDTDFYALWINAAWLLGLWAVGWLIFRRRELDT